LRPLRFSRTKFFVFALIPAQLAAGRYAIISAQGEVPWFVAFAAEI